MKKILIVTMIGLMVALVGCSNKELGGNANPSSTTQVADNNKTTNSEKSSSDSSSKSSDQITFTLDELAKFDGQNGNPAYVAVDGVVYDVTNAPRWRDGKHEGVTAGKDLSNMIGRSPHGKDVLKELQVVGKLQ